MTKTRLPKKRTVSKSSLRKASTSQYWSELSKAKKIMNEQVDIFIKQTNIRIDVPDESAEAETSVSTIFTSKGKIIIN